MTISAVDFPDAARRAVLAGIAMRARSRGFWTPKLKQANPDRLRLCAPHRVAMLPLNRMRQALPRPDASGKPAPAALRSLAQVLGWRFLILNDRDEAIAAAHSYLTEDGHYRLSDLNEGPFVASTLTALQKPLVLEAMSRKSGENPFAEVLLLFSPAICFAGVWARFEQEPPDFILPLDPGHLPTFAEVTPEQLVLVLSKASMAVRIDSHSGG